VRGAESYDRKKAWSSINLLILSGYLEPPHVSWVARILQTILVTLQEEFQEKPENETIYGTYLQRNKTTF